MKFKQQIDIFMIVFDSLHVSRELELIALLDEVELT